jgi:poly(hydroxyalkanoate) depolymerase family esterase
MEMKNWRGWRAKLGGLWRRMVRRVSRAAPGQSPPAPTRRDALAPEQPAIAVPETDALTAPRPATAKIPPPARARESASAAPDVERRAPRTAQPAPAAPSGKWYSETMMVAGGRVDLAPWVPPARDYRIYEPSALAPDPRLLVVLHGCRQTAEDIAEGTRLNEHADERGWLVVYPEQAIAANKYGCWNWFDPANQRGDGECAIIVAMQDAVRARYGMEHAHTFLAGMSAGGALVSQLALLYADRWSAVAIHSGLPYGAATDPWGAQRAMREGALNLAAAQTLRLVSGAGAVPALILHGNADDVVNRRNAELLVRQFLGWNGYFPNPSDWSNAAMPPVDDSHLKTPYGHPYILRDYGQPGRAPVRECEVVGMGHAWSGGDSALPYHDELGPDASALMVEFFAGVAAAAPPQSVT